MQMSGQLLFHCLIILYITTLYNNVIAVYESCFVLIYSAWLRLLWIEFGQLSS